MAQLGRALRSGRRGRKFKSCRLDDPAYWSSGQDAALSRRKPGFDSRIGHIIVRKRHCLVRTVPFFALGNQTEDCGSDVNRNIIRKLNIAVPEITVV